ncbi:MAG TPA: hypothetical protein H9987_07700 [Candidatus Luteococcus avicola]|nr:hypothetical protein [Candidatus Luteococcus avicola]
MLHGDVLMADLDVDQWRNAQQLLLRSAKQARRIICLLEKGAVVKCRHTQGVVVQDAPSSVDDLQQAADALFAANRETTDFVLVAERDAMDEYFAEYQNAWTADEDLDVYVSRSWSLLRDRYASRIVTAPEPADQTLGLQWKLGASHDQVIAAAEALVTPASTVVLAVHEAEALWTSLILRFDENRKVISIGTADPSLMDIHGDRATVTRRLVEFANGREGNVNLVVNCTREAAKQFLANPDKAAALATLGEEFSVTSEG